MSNKFRHMAIPGALLVAAITLVLPACGGGSGDVTSREILIDLASEGPEGISGSVSLSKSGDQTNVVVDAIVPSGGGQQGASIRSGTCANLGAETSKLPPLEEGTGADTLNVPLTTLLNEPHAIVVTKSVESDEVIACGNIVA